MIRRYLPRDTQEMARFYERYVSPLALVAGFVLDTLYLTRRVDLWQTNALFFAYLAIAGTGIVLINMIQTGRARHPALIEIYPLIPVAVQFAFGGLFSGYLSLYSRSAAFAGSWVTVAGLAVLLVGNERFMRFYARLPFQTGLYAAVLFSFLIFFLPVVVGQVGTMMFLASAATSAAAMVLLLALLFRAAPGIPAADRRKAYRAVAGVLLAINVLYFSGAIPPLPLALREAGVYHSIVRQPGGGGYLLTGEPLLWYQQYLQYDTTYHAAPGEPVYVWTVIFAPAGLSTVIEHRWQRYDDATGKWVVAGTFAFPITGGRDGGYRGYSFKSDVSPGRWRVDAVTSYGQVIGRVAFQVVAASGTPLLVQTTK